MTRKFQVRFQTGSFGSEHCKLSAAIRAMQRARRTARRNGDCQAIDIQVNEYDRLGAFWGIGELTGDEMSEIEASRQ